MRPTQRVTCTGETEDRTRCAYVIFQTSIQLQIERIPTANRPPDACVSIWPARQFAIACATRPSERAEWPIVVE
jgi:hypothetical protein